MKKPPIYAAIDIGSNNVKILIAEVIEQSFKVLEDLSEGVDLGEDALKYGYISDEKQDILLKLLQYYKTLIDTYQAQDVLTVATTAFRTASNREYVIERIERETGLHVEKLDDSTEKYLTYKSMRNKVENYKEFRDNRTVLVELSTAACDISFFRSSKMIRNDEIGIGTYPLTSILKSLLKETTNYASALEEYILTKVDYMRSVIKKKKKIDYYMVIGGEIKLIRDLYLEGRQLVGRDEFINVYEKALKNDKQMVDKAIETGRDWYGILASIIFFKVFLDVTQAKQMHIYNISLRDGMLCELFERHNPNSNHYAEFSKDPYTVTYEIAKRFLVNTAHIKYMAQTTDMIAKALQDEFKFTEEDLSLIKHAANLHEIGKAINLRNYLLSSRRMIRGMRIYGVSQKNVMRIAEICSIMFEFNHSDYGYYKFDQHLVKLAAILSLVDKLDASKLQKIQVQKVAIDKSTLRIEVKKKGDPVFEKMAVNRYKKAFRSIFGLEIKVREVS